MDFRGKQVQSLLVCLALFSFSSSVVATPLSGISQSACIYDINPLTGQASNPWSTGLGTAVGMSLSADGKLYVLTNRDSADHPAWLYAVGPAHTISPIGPTGLPSLVEGDIAFDPGTGTLYGAYDTLNNGRRLFTLDTQTGAATLLPSSPGGDISAMTFDRSSNLYVLDTSLGRLLTVDKTTGNPLTSLALSHPLGATAGMSFDPVSGKLFVADGGSGVSTLYTLNPATGALTTIGPTGVPGGLAGLAFVPEPATLLLIVIGAAAASKRRA